MGLFKSDDLKYSEKFVIDSYIKDILASLPDDFYDENIHGEKALIFKNINLKCNKIIEMLWKQL